MSVTKYLTSIGLLAMTSSLAFAGADQVYGNQWAWDNNFNNSNISVSFGSGSTPNLTFWYDFSSYGLYGYPAAIHGYHYGWNPAGDHLFPKQISAIGSANCTFSYSSGYSGSGSSNMAGDFAYDMFFRNDSSASTPELEVMIWGGNDSYPIGGQVATNVLSAGGYTFDLWMGYNSAAGYETITFIPHGSAGQGTLPTSGSVNVNLKTFFNYLASSGNTKSYFNNSMYLDVVECGLEITRGYGWVWVGANIPD